MGRCSLDGNRGCRAARREGESWGEGTALAEYAVEMHRSKRQAGSALSLHWSTSLPGSAAELSVDLKTTLFSDDIVNRLLHIEYRCLSSYPLVQARVQS